VSQHSFAKQVSLGSIGPTGSIGATGIQGVTGPTGPAGAATSLVNISGDATGVSNNTIIQKLTGFSGYVSVPSGSSLAFGALPGASGTIRLSSGSVINVRNAANSADLNLWNIDSGNNSMTFGDSTANGALIIQNGSSITINASLANAQTNINLSAGNGSSAVITLTAGNGTLGTSNGILIQTSNLIWQHNQGTPFIGQVTRVSDAATQNFTIQAQNPFATASNNINGGNLILMGGSGTATGTSAMGQVQMGSPIAGVSGPVQFAATSGALSTAANITLTAAQQKTPVIQLNGTVKTGNCNITLPNIVGSIWYFDISGVTLGANSMVFTTGSGTSATIGTTQVVTGLNLLTVAVVASNVVSAGGV
jgi:hypothetical protein